LRAAVHPEALHAGRIDPKLFGNFVELLDDVVPGMWAEMLNDRSFEGILPAARWSYYDGTLNICDRPWDTNTTWQIETGNAFNGARSARLESAAEPARLTQSGLVVRKGMPYRFSGYLRADPGVEAVVSLKASLPDGSEMVLAEAPLPKLAEGWGRFGVDLASRGATDRAVFELSARGKGRLWADKLSLMPADNLGGGRRDVVEVIKEVRPAVMRWGGSSVDPGHYRWKEGIGERDQRVPWPNETWGRRDPNDVGIDEFCQFCELTQSAPLICVSQADGPASAAELVEYCNGPVGSTWGARRAANGHPAPYGVKYWQIGNEINPDNAEYLARFPEFIAALKQVDPGVRIMTSFPGRKLLEKVGAGVAYVCPHHYTPDIAACDRDFNQITAMLNLTPGCAGIRLAVTEWNIDGGAWGLGRAKQATLEASLVNARYLNLLMRHSDKVEMACRSNLANSYCGAIIETAPGGWGVLKRASYHVMWLYSHHALPVPLRVEAAEDTLDLMACSSEDHKSVTLFAVNPHRDPVDLSVDFGAVGRPVRVRRGEVVCDGLDAGQPDVINHWNAPDRVSIRALSGTPGKITVPRFSAAAVDFELE